MKYSFKEHGEQESNIEENDYDGKSIHYPESTQNNIRNNETKEKRKLFAKNSYSSKEKMKHQKL